MLHNFGPVACSHLWFVVNFKDSSFVLKAFFHTVVKWRLHHEMSSCEPKTLCEPQNIALQSSKCDFLSTFWVFFKMCFQIWFGNFIKIQIIYRNKPQGKTEALLVKSLLLVLMKGMPETHLLLHQFLTLCMYIFYRTNQNTQLITLIKGTEKNVVKCKNSCFISLMSKGFQRFIAKMDCKHFP